MYFIYYIYFICHKIRSIYTHITPLYLIFHLSYGISAFTSLIRRFAFTENTLPTS